MTPENRNLPDWARRERQADFAWISDNLDVFWTGATAAFEDAGRGAILVDATSEPDPGACNPFAYFPQEQLKDQSDDDTKRIVSEYDPTEELLLVLLKSDNRTSTYQVRTVPERPQGTTATEAPPGKTGEFAPAQRLKLPEVEAPIQWEADGGARQRALISAG